MRNLYPSFASPYLWRDENQKTWLESDEWQRLRQQILSRDKFTCSYCDYHSFKYQIVHHKDGNPENNSPKNLRVICQMCNLVKHAGQGCEIQKIVDLYGTCKYPQTDVIRITRFMRDSGKSDSEIIVFLGLRQKLPFKMDRSYLRSLFAFVTSRKSSCEMYSNWLSYHTQKNKGQDRKYVRAQATLNDF